MEEFKISIEQFDGPLDLMLHLIREKELDLMNLDVNVLCDQYISYIRQATDLHLEIAGEYLAEMATLIEYKSKQMLPGNKDEIEDTYEEDTKDRLIKRLLEYQQYKEVAEELNAMYEERQIHMSRPLSNESEKWLDEANAPGAYRGNPYDLMKAMRRIMMRMHLQTPVSTKLTVREISLEDRTKQVRYMIRSLPKTFEFEALLTDVKDMPTFIATFLSVLDLARQHQLVFTTDENDKIWFQKGEGIDG